MPDLPPVTVVVLNYNGLQHLEDCFTSLLHVDYPTDRLELMLVDNASRDGSMAYVREHFPQVRLVQSPENLGFAGGNNLGARAATSQYVVFLNNDMRVDAGFVQALVGAVQTGPDVVSAGAKILNWDGSKLDFAGAAGHFAGYAYQVGMHKPLAADQFNQTVPMLFACGGAMLIDRQVFLDVGGFDEDYFMLFEDFDLGWRLWVMGYRVVFAPDAVVRHRHHGTLKNASNDWKQVLYKRNALYSVIKNYEDGHLGKVLPAVLLGSAAGVIDHAAAQGFVDLDEFVGPVHKRRSLTTSIDRQDVSTLVAMREVVHHLPQVMQKRRQVQQRRLRSDAEVALLFRWPFRHWPGVDAQTQSVLAETFGVFSIFESLPRRVLVISSDILPYPGMPTVGSGLRAWGIGEGLRSRGHEVVYSMPRAALVGREAIAPAEVLQLAWEQATLADVVRKAEPDVVVVCNWPVMALLPAELINVPVVLDQHGPHLLEREYQKYGSREENSRYKLQALSKADFFTCAGSKQLAYFQPWLERAGWSEAERRERSAAMPVSLSPDLPDRQPDATLSFVYGGVFLPWQDPSIGLTVLVEALDRHQDGKLYFYGGKHPVYPVDPGIYDQLLEQLKQSPRVVAPGMVSHDELIVRYRQAHVAMDVMRRNPERELAFTTRTVEYLWCGLPVIYHDYAELSDYIREYEAGWVVDAEDRAGIEVVLDQIFAHPEEVTRRSQNAQRLVRERLTWDRTIAPLDAFVRHPHMRPHEHRPARATVRNIRYLLGVAHDVYRQAGTRVLWQEGLAFLRRQVRS
jgi:GT2 family glycosyltransferase/glycosyltransferase involved in cell wall biosynthesis